MRPTMIYKGYLAAVEYEDSEELFYGHVVNSGASSIVTFAAAEELFYGHVVNSGASSIVTFAAAVGDVEGLQREFRISIDDYLASCEEDGVEPTRPAIG